MSSYENMEPSAILLMAIQILAYIEKIKYQTRVVYLCKPE